MIAIIEDNRFIRKGFEIMVSNEPDFELVGSYPSCEDAFYYEEIGKAKIVLMDIRLPGMSGIEGIKYLKKHFPEMLIIVCTAFEDDENVIKAISSGAVGFISKKTSPKELRTTLRNAIKGGSPMTPNVAHRIIPFFQRKLSNRENGFSELTQIEQTVLEKISSGNSCLSIARELYESEEEIFSQIRSIYLKLQSKLIHLNHKKITGD